MTQQQRDTMVERYLEGTMSQAERHQFLDLLDRDEGMRQALYAETLITKSVRSERMAMPGPTAASRARFLTMLATVAPETGAPGPEAGHAGDTGSSGLRGLAGGGAAKTIVTTLAGIAVTIGVVVVLPHLTSSPAPNSKTPPAAVSAPKSEATPPQLATPPAMEVAPQITTESPAEATPGNAIPAQSDKPAQTAGARQKSANISAERREDARPAHTTVHQESTAAPSTAQPKDNGPVLNGTTPAQINVKPVIVNPKK